MEAFAWVINHFMHILMGLELVLNLFDWPKNIIPCFPFPILEPQWQPEGSYKIGSVRPSVIPSGHFLGNPYEVVCGRAGFSGKLFLPPLIWENGPTTGFFEFIEKFGHQFLLNLFYNENLHCWLCSCTNLIFLFLSCEPKCSQPIRLEGSLINQISRIN